MDERTERRLQDYVDGRMTDSERSAFERELEAHPVLADELAELSVMREALRESAPAPSPGFYTRARARFEERHTAKQPWYRGHVWRTVGVVAAAVLVFVIFLPVGERAPVPELQDALEPSQVKNEEAESAVAPGDDDREPSLREALPPRTKQGPDRIGSQASEPAPPPPPPEQRRQLTSKGEILTGVDGEKKTREAAAAPESAVAETSAANEALESQRRERFAPAPPAVAAQEEPAEAGATAEKRLDSRDEGRSAAFKSQVSGVSSSPPSAPLPLPTATVPLDADVADRFAEDDRSGGRAAAVTLVESPEAWDRLLSDQGRPDGLFALAPDFSRQRVVLLHDPGGAIDCTSIVRANGGAHRLVYRTDTTGEHWGCAIVLPRDGLGVTAETGGPEREP